MQLKKLLLCGGYLRLMVSLAGAGDKPQTWTEVRSPHFVVVTNASAKQGRRVADQFEQERAVFQMLVPHARLDPGVLFLILAVKDEKSLPDLLPAYWEKKGLMHPAGYFASGQDKHYVALRMDVQGDTPYHVLYHEYVHLLVRLNFEHIPVWLNEGLAEFYGNMSIGEKEVTLGNYSLSHLMQLRQSKLLPLDVLFLADAHSPYYNEENKASVFYAESWALVHYLMLGKDAAHSGQLVQYLKLIQEKKLDALEAARSAFGDLGQLFRTLSGYWRQESFPYLRMKSPALLTDNDFPTREIPAAESLAVRGDFYVHTQRPVEARDILQQAQALDPKLASIYESFGLLALHEGNIAQATESFARAAELDSHSFLAQYFAAIAAIQQAGSPDDLDRAETRFKRAIELNPDYAEAYSSLAHVYLLRGDNLEKALEFAQAAVSLEPGTIAYRLNLGYVLLRMRRTADALAIGQRILAQATTEQDRLAARSFLDQVRQFSEYLEGSQVPERRGSPRGSAPPPSSTTGETKAGPSQSPTASPPTGKRVTLIGQISDVTCEGFALHLDVISSGQTQKLYARNYARIEYLSLGWEPPKNFNPCDHLKGHRARITFVAAENRADPGEIVEIEVRE